MTLIIGFSGKKQSGKTTSANFLYSIALSTRDGIDQVTLTNQGTIQVKKNGSDQIIDVDVVKYYNNIGFIDEDIAKIIDDLSSHIKIYSFADPLKQDICMNMFGLSYEQCYGTDEQKNEPTNMIYDNKYLSGRDIMQLVGTDFFRAVKPNIWPEATIRKILKDRPNIALVTDCRFPNEVDVIKDNNGIVIRLTRTLPKIDGEIEHKSETALDESNYDWSKFNYVIDNKDLDILEQCNMVYEILTKEVK